MMERLIGRVAGITVMIAEDAASSRPAVVSVEAKSTALSLEEVRDLILVLEATGNIADVWRRTEQREPRP
jgi:hypothetical protein